MSILFSLCVSNTFVYAQKNENTVYSIALSDTKVQAELEATATDEYRACAKDTVCLKKKVSEHTKKFAELSNKFSTYVRPEFRNFLSTYCAKNEPTLTYFCMSGFFGEVASYSSEAVTKGIVNDIDFAKLENQNPSRSNITSILMKVIEVKGSTKGDLDLKVMGVVAAEAIEASKLSFEAAKEYSIAARLGGMAIVSDIEYGKIHNQTMTDALSSNKYKYPAKWTYIARNISIRSKGKSRSSGKSKDSVASGTSGNTSKEKNKEKLLPRPKPVDISSFLKGIPCPLGEEAECRKQNKKQSGVLTEEFRTLTKSKAVSKLNRPVPYNGLNSIKLQSEKELNDEVFRDVFECSFRDVESGEESNRVPSSVSGSCSLDDKMASNRMPSSVRQKNYYRVKSTFENMSFKDQKSNHQTKNSEIANIFTNQAPNTFANRFVASASNPTSSGSNSDQIKTDVMVNALFIDVAKFGLSAIMISYLHDLASDPEFAMQCSQARSSSDLLPYVLEKLTGDIASFGGLRELNTCLKDKSRGVSDVIQNQDFDVFASKVLFSVCKNESISQYAKFLKSKKDTRLDDLLLCKADGKQEEVGPKQLAFFEKIKALTEKQQNLTKEIVSYQSKNPNLTKKSEAKLTAMMKELGEIHDQIESIQKNDLKNYEHMATVNREFATQVNHSKNLVMIDFILRKMRKGEVFVPNFDKDFKLNELAGNFVKANCRIPGRLISSKKSVPWARSDCKQFFDIVMTCPEAVRDNRCGDISWFNQHGYNINKNENDKILHAGSQLQKRLFNMKKEILSRYPLLNEVSTIDAGKNPSFYHELGYVEAAVDDLRRTYDDIFTAVYPGFRTKQQSTALFKNLKSFKGALTQINENLSFWQKSNFESDILGNYKKEGTNFDVTYIMDCNSKTKEAKEFVKSPYCKFKRIEAAAKRVARAKKIDFIRTSFCSQKPLEFAYDRFTQDKKIVFDYMDWEGKSKGYNKYICHAEKIAQREVKKREMIKVGGTAVEFAGMTVAAIAVPIFVPNIVVVGAVEAAFFGFGVYQSRKMFSDFDMAYNSSALEGACIKEYNPLTRQKLLEDLAFEFKLDMAFTVIGLGLAPLSFIGLADDTVKAIRQMRNLKREEDLAKLFKQGGFG